MWDALYMMLNWLSDRAGEMMMGWGGDGGVRITLN